jgi:phosphoribosylformimino-5-aminoimidazole carboxamide ribotide isomerase
LSAVSFTILPAIDLRGGRCVRLFQGDYARETVFGDDPLAMVSHWEALGARWLHLVDLDGARQGQPVQLGLIGAMIKAAGVPVQVGGGLRRLADVEAALEAGAARVVLGTAAVGGGPARDFRLACVERFGPRVAVGLDARGGRLAVRGWTETTDLEAFAFAERVEAEGFQRIVYTDIARDGALSGPNLEHLARLAAERSLAVVASGGIGSVDDLIAVQRTGAEAAIVGQALYTGAVSLPEALAATDRGADRARAAAC